MNGEKFVKGCAGAVWSNGQPSRSYCRNIGNSRYRFPWWAACCEWVGSSTNGKCEPKDVGNKICGIIH